LQFAKLRRGSCRRVACIADDSKMPWHRRDSYADVDAPMPERSFDRAAAAEDVRVSPASCGETWAFCPSLPDTSYGRRSVSNDVTITRYVLWIRIPQRVVRTRVEDDGPASGQVPRVSAAPGGPGLLSRSGLGRVDIKQHAVRRRSVSIDASFTC